MTEKKMRRVLLIVPPTGRYIREERCQTPLDGLFTVALRPPIDLMMIAAVLEECGTIAVIRDYPAIQGNWDQYQSDLAAINPDTVFISVTTPTLQSDVRAATLAKNHDPHIRTIAKGAHFLSNDLGLLHRYPMLDILLRGEYEETCVELCQGKDLLTIEGLMARYQGCAIDTGVREPVEDLDKLPLPARHLIDNNLYLRPDLGVPQTTISVSRGCPHGCAFCLASHLSGRKLRTRSPNNIMMEIQSCTNQYGIKDFLFRSDLFTHDKDWVLELCDLIIHHGLSIRWCCNSRVDTLEGEVLRRMKQAGCWLIAFGLETGSEMLLDAVNKKQTLDQARFAINLCRSEGVKSSAYFLIGLPDEDETTFQETVRFAQQLEPDFVEFFYAYPFEGTPFYAEAVQSGLLAPQTYPTRGYNLPSIPTRYLDLPRLQSMRREALRKYYLRLPVIWRTLAGTRSVRAGFNYLRFGFKQLFDMMVKS